MLFALLRVSSPALASERSSSWEGVLGSWCFRLRKGHMIPVPLYTHGQNKAHGPSRRRALTPGASGLPMSPLFPGLLHRSRP